MDLSESQLLRAEEKALEAGVEIILLKADARDLPFVDEFDLAIMLCEGAFPLMETDEMNFQILQSAARALKPEGKLVFTTLNGLFPLFHSVRDLIDPGAKEGGATHSTSTFDVMTFRDKNTIFFEDDLGTKKELQCNERYYVPSEISWLLKSLGFKTVNIFGARLGAFSRMDELSVEDFEMLVVAEKQGLGTGGQGLEEQNTDVRGQ